MNHDLSPKVKELFSVLKARANYSTALLEFRCIIFVEERSTASALSEIIKAFAPMLFPVVKPGFVTGGRSNGRLQKFGKQGEDKTVFEQFRYGDINCIVATRVAEEGVDMYLSININYLVLHAALSLFLICFDQPQDTCSLVAVRDMWMVPSIYFLLERVSSLL
jgi:ERCC4-related helicase